MTTLKQRKCVPCEGGVPALTSGKITELLKPLKGWKRLAVKPVIRARYKTRDFLTAVRIIRDVASLAEKQGHHPDIHLTDYRLLTFELTTHAVKGLTVNDFILARQISRTAREEEAVLLE